MSAQRAYSAPSAMTPETTPIAQKIHPIGLDGRREATTAPTPPITIAKAIEYPFTPNSVGSVGVSQARTR